MSRQINPYIQNLRFTVDDGVEQKTRSGTVLFKAPMCTFFNPRDIAFMRSLCDEELLEQQIAAFKMGQAAPVPDGWNIASNDKGYGHHFYTEGWLEHVICTLEADAKSRQAVIYIPGDFRTGYMPCWMSFSFIVKFERLNMMMHSRSVDLIKGLPYDINVFNYALRGAAHALGVAPGYIAASMGNPHIYIEDVPLAEKLIKESYDV
jgi:hypothetical protein